MNGISVDVAASVQHEAPGILSVQGVVAVVVGRRHELAQLRPQVWAVLLHLPANLARAIEPLVGVLLGAPGRRPRGGPVLADKVVGLVAVLVGVKVVAANGLAGERRSVDERLPALCRPAALGQVEAVRELDAGPGLVRVEKRRAEVDGGWVVVGPRRVVGAVELRLQRRVVQRIVLRVAADADVRLRARVLLNVLQEVV